MNKTAAKPIKGRIPAGFADGGKVKPFSGKDSKAEEMAEARAVRNGKTPVSQYVRKEVAEHKKEGESVSRAELAKKGKAIATGKLSPQKYAADEAKEKPKMANGGMVRGKKGKC